MCIDAGRVQDFYVETDDTKAVSQLGIPTDRVFSPEMREILKGGKNSIPILINLLTDLRRVEGEPLNCFWTDRTVGTAAFIILLNLFEPANINHIQNSPVPGMTSSDMLNLRGDHTLFDEERQLSKLTAKDSRRELQAKFRRIWNKYKDQVYWDDNERCFLLRPSL
jgi:hypothetical protein